MEKYYFKFNANTPKDKMTMEAAIDKARNMCIGKCITVCLYARHDTGHQWTFLGTYTPAEPATITYTPPTKLVNNEWKVTDPSVQIPVCNSFPALPEIEEIIL